MRQLCIKPTGFLVLDLLVTLLTNWKTYLMEFRKTKFVFLKHLMSSQKCAKNITHEHRLPQWQAVAKVGVYSHDVLFASQVQTSQMNQTGNPPPGALLLH